MFVKKAVFDEWIGCEDFGGNIEDINWEYAEKLILQMDGEKHTIITFSDVKEENYICIGGGNNGLYNVYAGLNDNAILCELKNKNSKLKSEVELVTGGQFGLFSAEDCVTLDIAKIVIEKFFKSGEIFDELDWEIKE